MSEHSKRKAGRAMLSKAGYGNMGGHFKKGGHVKGEAAKDVHKHEAHLHKGEPKTKLKDGGCADGGSVRPRADRLARGGKTKAGKTVVNVIVGGGQKQPQPVPVPVPVGGPPPGGPMPPPPGAGPGGPPMPPDGAPPMGLKRGGRAGGTTPAKFKMGSQREDMSSQVPAGHFAKGGRTKMPVPMSAGAGGAKGRLQKAKDYG